MKYDGHDSFSFQVAAIKNSTEYGKAIRQNGKGWCHIKRKLVNLFTLRFSTVKLVYNWTGTEYCTYFKKRGHDSQTRIGKWQNRIPVFIFFKTLHPCFVLVQKYLSQI